jgi:hypothetical protein
MWPVQGRAKERGGGGCIHDFGGETSGKETTFFKLCINESIILKWVFKV